MTYTTTELAAQTGITVRKLQWWDERAILHPDTSDRYGKDQKRRRVYSQQRALRAVLLQRLTRPPHHYRVSLVAGKLDNRLFANGHRYLILPTYLNNWKTQKLGRPFTVPTPAEAIERCAIARTGVILIDLADLAQSLAVKR
jgi:hypothetical protein